MFGSHRDVAVEARQARGVLTAASALLDVMARNGGGDRHLHHGAALLSDAIRNNPHGAFVAVRLTRRQERALAAAYTSGVGPTRIGRPSS